MFIKLKKKSKSKSVKIAALAGIMCIATACPTQACSVFSAHNMKEQSFVAKNFDWNSGEGFLVQNPRKKQRQLLLNPSKEWTAKYNSLSLTIFGPGLPVSGMNEKGLVVETLVDFESELAEESGVKKFVSLEWAQYVLDNFKSIDEVIKFGKSTSFDQLIVPVHFFVCDVAGECAVFERRSSETLHITSGNNLKKPVLANRGWS